MAKPKWMAFILGFALLALHAPVASANRVNLRGLSNRMKRLRHVRTPIRIGHVPQVLPQSWTKIGWLPVLGLVLEISNEAAKNDMPWYDKLFP